MNEFKRLGFKMRVGGGLAERVFGVFGVCPEQDNEEDDEVESTQISSDYRQAIAWAKKQTAQSEMIGHSFTFETRIAQTKEEYTALYNEFIFNRCERLYR